MTMEKEQYDVKYMRDLLEYTNAYFYALINEIYTGVAINLGMSPKDAYKLANNNPNDLKKAKFFTNIFNKFKDIFKHKVPKFRYDKKLHDDRKPMTPEQWDKFNKSIKEYWNNHATVVAEDVTIKAHELGKNTTFFRKKKKPYENKSLYQVDFDQYDGDMPSNIVDAYKKYDFENYEKKALNKSWSSVAMYVQQTNDEVQNAIRQQVQIGIDNGLSSVAIASNLYWEVEKNENLNNKYTAENLRRNWQRVASTELNTVYENAILVPYEVQAMESLKDPTKAVYMSRTGGTCPWCLSMRGTIMRVVPSEIVTDPQNEKLSSMGIKDPNTNIGLWIGKSNYGLKQKDWMSVCPGHPNNIATNEPIDLSEQFYNRKTDDVERIQKKDKYIPQLTDPTDKSAKEKEFRKPTFIDTDLVRYNNNVYERVEPEQYADKKAQWDKDPSKPIPMKTDSTRYDKIFGAAERNR